jgi:hypothetical protein
MPEVGALLDKDSGELPYLTKSAQPVASMHWEFLHQQRAAIAIEFKRIDCCSAGLILNNFQN